MKLFKKGLLLPTVLGMAFVLGGCISSDDVAESILGTVSVSGNIVDASNNDAPLQDVTVQATTDGLPGATQNYDSSIASTDASGNFSLSVVKDLLVYLRLNRTGYTVFNSALFGFSGTTDVGEIPMITTADAEIIIDAAFPASGLNLADKAWFIIEAYDGSGDDLAGVTFTALSASSVALPVESVYNDQNDCINDYTTNGPTVNCTPTRVGPMYIGYYNNDELVNISADLYTQNQQALVRVGEVAVVVFEP